MPKTKLEIAAEVYRALDNPRIVRGRVSGTASASQYQSFLGDLTQTGILNESRDNDRHIIFNAPSAHDEFFAASMADLIAAPSRKKKAPANFFIAELDYLHSANSNDKPPQVAAYLDMISLVESLSKIADHGTEPAATKLIFFHKEKIELLLTYGCEALTAIPGLARFREKFIDDDIHSEQKQTIIKSVLLELSKEFEGQPFSIELLRNKFEEFSRRVASGYQLYVSEFSFQKVKAEVEKSKFEFISRINKVFSEIQNQLLAVPAALIIAGSQFETAEKITLKNSLILGGAIAFTAFMLLLIVNQRNTLRSIFNEIDNEWTLIKNKHNAIKAQFDQQYDALESRYKYQILLLETVSLIVVSACLATVVLFYYYSANREFPIQPSMILGFFWILFVVWRAFSTIPLILKSSREKPNNENAG
ncbi:hypothetical protein [Pseudomonas aeruginosa]|uniref:hypothetical protein n=1 Tax=Pseudomonas aeruginosa TaxID=287 RepID=UPI003CC6C798